MDGMPELVGNHTDIRFKEVHKLLNSRTKANKDNSVIISSFFNSKATAKLRDYFQQERGWQWFEIDTRMNSFMAALNSLKWNPEDVRIIYCGTNLGGCINSSTETSAVPMSSMDWKCVIYLPGISEDEMPGATYVEKYNQGISKLYRSIQMSYRAIDNIKIVGTYDELEELKSDK